MLTASEHQHNLHYQHHLLPGHPGWARKSASDLASVSSECSLSVVYLSMLYIILLFIRAPFYVLLVFVAMCSVFWLFWLSCQYLPSDWLERLLWGSLTVARGSSPESPGWRVLTIFLVYCIVSLFYYVSVLSPGPTWYIFLLLWHDVACLCWKCR